MGTAGRRKWDRFIKLKDELGVWWDCSRAGTLDQPQDVPPCSVPVQLVPVNSLQLTVFLTLPRITIIPAL